jgi:hypothetical protein
MQFLLYCTLVLKLMYFCQTNLPVNIIYHYEKLFICIVYYIAIKTADAFFY